MLVIAGPTAAGKSRLGMEVARRVGGEIISVDSMQVYRGMDIGTAKPSPAERREIPHYMLDLVEPSEEFSVACFQTEARRIIDSRPGPLLLVGGSGLHLRAVIDPLEFPPTDREVRHRLDETSPTELTAELLAADPLAGDHVDLSNPRRVVRAVEILRLSGLTPSDRAVSRMRKEVEEYRSLFPVVMVGVDPGGAVGTRVRDRVDRMWEEGLVSEVERLEPRLGRTAGTAVGYRQVVEFLAGYLDAAGCREEIIRATLGLVKRQRTFFRRDPRITWLEWSESIDVMVERVMREWDR